MPEPSQIAAVWLLLLLCTGCTGINPRVADALPSGKVATARKIDPKKLPPLL